jgi:hypothetical protein
LCIQAHGTACIASDGRRKKSEDPKTKMVLQTNIPVQEVFA